MHYLVIGFMIITMVTTLVTAGVAGRKGFEKATARNISISKVSSDEFQTADLNQVYKDDRQGQLQVVGAMAEVVMSAQSLAAPGVSPNPIGIGVSEGMTLGGWAVSAAERTASGDAGSGSAAGDSASSGTSGDAGSSGPSALLGQGGVDLETAPDDYYVGWYYIEDGVRYVRVDRVGYYRRYVGSGGVEAPVKKYPLTRASWGMADIMFWIGDSVTAWKDDGDIGVINGVDYDFTVGHSPDIYREYGQ